VAVEEGRESAVAALRLHGFSVMVCVKEFAATGCGARPSTAASVTGGRLSVMVLLEILGVHIHHNKGVFRGTKRLPLLCVIVETRRRYLLSPRNRLAKVVTMAKAVLYSAIDDCRDLFARHLMLFTRTSVSCALAAPSYWGFPRRGFTTPKGGGRKLANYCTSPLGTCAGFQGSGRRQAWHALFGGELLGGSQHTPPPWAGTGIGTTRCGRPGSSFS